jgi:ribosomal protein S27E
MDESGRRDLELLLLAVRHGVLSNDQVEQCLREWEEQPGDASLSSAAIRKGFLTEQRLRELASSGKDPGSDATAASVEVDMRCPDCGREQTLVLEAALKKPRCARCSTFLRFRRQAGGPSPRPLPGPLPDEVLQALEDPKNRFSKYALLSKLGSGGMGEVWGAWDTVLNRKIALKFPKSMADNEIRRLYMEARGAGSLSHVNIASIYEIAEAEGRHYIAMQFISGKTAEDLAKEKPGETREFVRWLRDAARGVHDAHERGVIHRDLKPANLMIDAEGRVFVMDFGLAKLAGGQGSGTVSGVILGTPAFMPPEQAAGNAAQVDRRSDIYALGATLYVLLSGRRPYEGETATDILVQILTSEPPGLKQAWPEAPWELEAIVGRAMARPRDQRYDTAKEFADDLERYLSNEPIRTKRQGLAYRVSKVVQRRKAAIAGITAFVLLLAGAIALSRRFEPAPPAPGVDAPDRLKEWSALFARLQPLLAPDAFDRSAVEPLLARVEREFPDQKRGVDLFVENEFKRLSHLLETLPRSSWLESAESVRKYRGWLAFMKQPTLSADRILAYRGTFSLAIQVSPYAEVRSPFVEGLPPEDRLTPLMVKDVEIRDGGIELFHPQLGRQTVALPPLRNGALLTLEGDLRRPETLKLREGP